jgi:hypothetical protein
MKKVRFIVAVLLIGLALLGNVAAKSQSIDWSSPCQPGAICG